MVAKRYSSLSRFTVELQLFLAAGHRLWDAAKHVWEWFGSRLGSIGALFWRGGVAQIFDFLKPRYMFLTDPAKVQLGVTDGRTDARTEAPTI